jgi:hypothetical protein
MTDASETNPFEPASTPTAAPEQKFSKGDEVTVMRGLDRDKSGTVLGADTVKNQYAIAYTDGSFGVQNFVNVKAVTEGAVSVGKLAGLLHEFNEDGSADSLADFLGARVPGFAKAYEQN